MKNKWNSVQPQLTSNLPPIGLPVEICYDDYPKGDVAWIGECGRWRDKEGILKPWKWRFINID